MIEGGAISQKKPRMNGWGRLQISPWDGASPTRKQECLRYLFHTGGPYPNSFFGDSAFGTLKSTMSKPSFFTPR
ncbi:hypothetical protein llg_20870 [Luteolibacter sp. LG18]|nr:hypothetical protein llg_20870 [Luteolibacter sp. LG18]